MMTAKIFRHGGSQAVRLPKAFRFAGDHVAIERQGDRVVLFPWPRTSLSTLREVAAFMASTFPQAYGFPAREKQPAQTRNLNR